LILVGAILASLVGASLNIVSAILLTLVGALPATCSLRQLMEQEPGPRGSPHDPQAPTACDAAPFAPAV
jgi:hypothetical protein